MEGEGAKGKAEGDVVDSIGFGGGGGRSKGDGDFRLPCHGSSKTSMQLWFFGSCYCLITSLNVRQICRMRSGRQEHQVTCNRESPGRIPLLAYPAAKHHT